MLRAIGRKEVWLSLAQTNRRNFASFVPSVLNNFNSLLILQSQQQYRNKLLLSNNTRIIRCYQAAQPSASSPSPKPTHNEGDRNDPFVAGDPKLELQAHLIGDAKADTRHFMEQASFTPPLESAISAQSRLTLAKWQDEAKHTLPHPVWTAEAVYSIRVTHFRPEGIVDRMAYWSVKALRSMFDICSGYALGRIDERGWLNRIVYLETVAGVPGMVGAMVRHLNSLRRMERDYGWIHTLLEEAENERMHLMTALVLKKPTALFRVGVLVTQSLFLVAFTVSYLLSRRFAHRFVGYLEEEAVITYSKLLKEIDNGHLPLFESLPAPPVARDYWCLSNDATFRDVILAIRADESHHREVNHTFADLQVNTPNPFKPGH